MPGTKEPCPKCTPSDPCWYDNHPCPRESQALEQDIRACRAFEAWLEKHVNDGELPTRSDAWLAAVEWCRKDQACVLWGLKAKEPIEL